MARFIQLPVRCYDEDKIETRAFNLDYITDFKSSDMSWIARGFPSVIYFGSGESTEAVYVNLTFNQLWAYIDDKSKS